MPHLQIASLLRSIVVLMSLCLAELPVLYAQSDLQPRESVRIRIKDICRLKGQEENTLQGIGLVVGLKGSGDGDNKPMVRALSRAMQVMGAQISSDIQGRLIEKEMANAKNVAFVIVTATIPTSGAQQGDKLNCTVSAISAKSLEGGNLLLCNLIGPRADVPVTYALAQGPITIDDKRTPTSGKVVGGCKMEQTIKNEFVLNNKITLVLNPEHSSFTTSQNIEDMINQYHNSLSNTASRSNSSQTRSSGSNDLARAIDQMHVEVTIPTFYRDRPVQFVSEIMDLNLVNIQNQRRVVIKEREGVIVIGEDVTIDPVGITHRNLSVSTRGGSVGNGFVGVSSQDGKNVRPTLKNLVDAMNVLAVPTDDMIAIIKTLKRSGQLYGELVIE